jgi:hypothetical protein
VKVAKKNLVTDRPADRRTIGTHESRMRTDGMYCNTKRLHPQATPLLAVDPLSRPTLGTCADHSWLILLGSLVVKLVFATWQTPTTVCTRAIPGLLATDWNTV